MIDHLGINCADYAKSQEFYDRVLGVLGYSRQMDFGEAIGYGSEGHPDFWIAEGAGMGPNRETHFAFAAADHDAVQAFTTPRSKSAPSRCTHRDCGRSTTRATLRPLSETPTATMSKPSVTGRVRRYG